MNLLCTYFYQKIFRQIDSLVISFVKTLLSRNFCQKCVRLDRSSFYTSTLCSEKEWKIYSHRKFFFRQINYLVISLVKPSLWRNFCQKCVRVNFRNFHTVAFRPQFIWKRIESFVVYVFIWAVSKACVAYFFISYFMRLSCTNFVKTEKWLRIENKRKN